MSDPTPPAVAATASTPSPPAQAPAASALASAPVLSPQGADDPHAWAPEKHRVMKDGVLDLAATAAKVGTAYQELEKRLGQRPATPAVPTEAAPATPDAYSLAGLPEGVDVAALRADPAMKGFLQSAHAKGMTDAQVSWAVGQYLSVSGARDAELVAQDSAAAVGALRKVWAGPGEYDSNMGHARRAFEAYCPEPDRAELDAVVGNSPAALRFLARLGRELAEDRPPGTGQGQGVAAITSEAELQSLMRHPAYRDDKHADSVAVKARVRAYFQRRAGNGVA